MYEKLTINRRNVLENMIKMRNLEIYKMRLKH